MFPNFASTTCQLPDLDQATSLGSAFSPLYANCCHGGIVLKVRQVNASTQKLLMINSATKQNYEHVDHFNYYNVLDFLCMHT